MDKLIYALTFLTLLCVAVFTFPEGLGAALLCAVCSVVVIFLIKHFAEKPDFLIRWFLVALILRVGLGALIYFFDARDFFGGDYGYYDLGGNRLMEIWQGVNVPQDFWTDRATETTGPGWGMIKLTGFIYFFLGRNTLAVQLFCCVVGAATAPLAYFCAHRCFGNIRAARLSTIILAVYPAMVIWSCQMSKDGLLVFCLVLIITGVLQLQEKFNYLSLAVVLLSLFAVLSLRFYIFYIVLVAIVGSFAIGTTTTTNSIVRRVGLIVMLGLGLTFFGVGRIAEVEFDKFANIEAIQSTRSGLAGAKSGYGGDIDVTTTRGALTAIPIGFLYLMLSPFPWEMANLRQLITLPEILIWWACMPLLAMGLIYSIRNKLRKAMPILIFTLLLTVAYSLTQGNVGTAYRQRTQIQVFHFMFIAVGGVLVLERRENKKLIKDIAKGKRPAAGMPA